MKTIFIINPAAAKGALGKAWASLAKGLQGKIHHFDAALTQKRGDAIHLTAKAVNEGYEMIVAVGGDGTLNECVNGFMCQEVRVDPILPILAVLPFGRGSDLARALGISRLPEKAIQYLRGTKTRLLDVGKVTWEEQGKTKISYFINNAYFGMGPLIDYHAKQCPKFFGAWGSYFYGLLRSKLEYKYVTATIQYNRQVREHTFCNMVIANGPYYGAGMVANPHAQLDDGQLNVTVIGKMGLARSLKFIPKLYDGTYLSMKEMATYQSNKFVIQSKNPKEKVPIDLDGDTVAELPATFEVLPKVIRFKI